MTIVGWRKIKPEQRAPYITGCQQTHVLAENQRGELYFVEGSMTDKQIVEALEWGRNEIIGLRALIERYEQALRRIAEPGVAPETPPTDRERIRYWRGQTVICRDIAREALGGDNG